MSNSELIEKLTLGKEALETVKVKTDDTTIDVTLRPLSDGELSKLKSMEQKSLIVKVGVNSDGKRESVKTNNVDINTGEFTEAQAKTMYHAVAWSMSVNGEKYTPEMIEGLMPGVPGQLFEHVIRISQLTEDDLVTIKSFLKNK